MPRVCLVAGIDYAGKTAHRHGRRERGHAGEEEEQAAADCAVLQAMEAEATES